MSGVNGSARGESDEVWAARRVVEQHKTPESPHEWRPGCKCCADDHCELLAWAVEVLDEHDRRQGG